MNVWPRAKTISAAVLGRLSLVLSGPPVHANYRGLQSAYPWITFAISKDLSERWGMCARCGDVEDEPPLPKADGSAALIPTPLFIPGTDAHALFVLAWLHLYANKHRECVEVEA